MPNRSLSIEQVLTMLAATPPRLPPVWHQLNYMPPQITMSGPHVKQVERIVNTMHRSSGPTTS